MDYKNHIKAIAFDFDGTLIDYNYKATEYTKKALDELRKKDYKICLSSGRPVFLGLKAFRKTFGDYPLDYVFGSNGSEFCDVKKGTTELLFPLSNKDIRYLDSIIKADFLTKTCYEDSILLTDKQIDNPELIDWMNARWLTPKVYDFSKEDKSRSKMLILNDKKDREKEIEYLKNIDLSMYSCAYSSPNCLEIVPKGVNKAKAVEKLTQILNCDKSQILTFGDMENDMPMLLNSTGVIMDNAQDELKTQIPLHTSRVDEKGVYEFLHDNGLI